MIVLRDLCKSFDGTTAVVDNLSLRVGVGELHVLLGESGCGKTTTLRTIMNRLIEPSSGAIEIDGKNALAEDPVALRRRIGYVLQAVALFPHYTVARNIGVVPRLLGWEEQTVERRVDELLELVNMDPATFRNRRPSQLSGGQQQRVGVARALATRPSIVLMDEPFGALDPITRNSLQLEYASLARDLGVTTILVTHDMMEALLMADRITVLKAGKIVQHGTPRELLTRPAQDYVRDLVATPLRHMRSLEQLLSDAGVAGD